jgi:hypothetical protein
VLLSQLNFTTMLASLDGSRLSLEESRASIGLSKKGLEQTALALEDSKLSIELSKKGLQQTALALEDSKLSIQLTKEGLMQKNKVKKLTGLAFIFVPLSFVASIFGINVDVLKDNQAPWWILIVGSLVPSHL